MNGIVEESEHYVLAQETTSRKNVTLLNKSNGMVMTFTDKDIKRWEKAYARHQENHPDAAPRRRLDDLWTKFMLLGK